MEKPKSAKETRKEAFDKTAEAAKALGDRALRDIDLILAEEEEVRRNLEESKVLSDDERTDALRAYHATRFPIHDGDPLATPIAFYERYESIFE
jgi:hypothetical protein